MKVFQLVCLYQYCHSRSHYQDQGGGGGEWKPFVSQVRFLNPINKSSH